MKSIKGNTEALEKYKAILLATINYELERTASSYEVHDGELVHDSFYKMKQYWETNYLSDGLAKMKKTLKSFTKPLMLKGDMAYDTYIKATTGYDFDLFGNISGRIQKIIDSNAIKNKQEQQDVMAMIALCLQTSVCQYNVAHLRNMILNYEQLQSKKLEKQELQVYYVAIISSPDFLHYIELYETNNSSTQIQVSQRVGGRSVGLFSVKGTTLGLKVYWKNNTHIVIEHSKALALEVKPRQIETYRGCFLQVDYVLVD